ncbi:ABC transporter permease [Flavilitoribacter nigricans]|uniref:FtsX-like permease family protein n=1 Tax=Flavilitoribacter nigricans (strain ATCC 23147 / DSM 23189 / NBRC 102662 / NCIMB 1420 / SS-2) TaxID=1122177 RepID=A0A2D0N972_FLAN2|nr:ABC transporter permease [Flavilitoribacter nigricans]PHN05072.1 hypothetical protein CRP01_18785 [Flavilitoribacter nigricans DSM 23189 = NBRC 102662]
MLFHHFKVLIRTLLRNKTYTALNIVGLTGGLIAFLLITLYVQYEFSFDQYHENKDRIYRVVKQNKGSEYFGSDRYAVTPPPLAPTLQEEFPEVEAATHLYAPKSTLIGVDQATYLEEKVVGASPEIFDIFSIEILSGNQGELLTEKYSGVISESLAQKYFGNASPIGQTILYKGSHPYTIVGVMADLPANSHFRMDLLLDFAGMLDTEPATMDQWQNNFFYTYCLLRDEATPQELEAKLPSIVAKYLTDANGGGAFNNTRFYLQPVPSIHLQSRINFEINPNGDIRTLRVFILIALLILLIAGINYINLSTAKAFRRAREIGIRKTIGAHRRQLVFQFLGESFFLTFCALILTLVVVHYLLPGFSEFVGRDLSLSPVGQIWLIPFLLVVFLLVGLLSGLYPAVVLSSFKPLSILKSHAPSGQKKSTLRNTLVVAQFAVSAALIISTLVISRQLNFIKSKDMGFNREQVIVLNIRDFELRKKTQTLKEELLRIPEVKMVSTASDMPNFFDSSTGANWPGKPEDVDVRLYTGQIDYDYLDLFEMELAEGRGFSREYGDEKNAVLLNESAVKALGWEEPIGRQIFKWGRDTATVVGVLKDFHHNSLHLSIAPMQLFFTASSRQVAVKVSGKNMAETIAAIEAAQKQFAPNYPVEYQFFEESFAQAYESEIKTGKMASWFTLLIIIIACLGLYGLSAFTAEMRIKEVGIRKILGASVGSLLLLLSRNFLSLIILAFLIATPLAYYFMSLWLENFVYHIDIGLSVFIWTLVAMLAITLLTVGYRTLRTALGRPVEALQQED